MKVYEVAFIDIGFLVSYELWSLWLSIGLAFGFALLIRDIVRGRWRFYKKVKLHGLIFATAFTVFAWPVALFLFFKFKME